MADADWIEAGKQLRVVSIQNATITVREVPPCD
jgi:membrane-bound ClpP family serine protease